MSDRSLTTLTSLQRLARLLPEALHELLDFIADHLADRIVARLSTTTGDYYDQDTLPAGLTRKAYLRAARLGEFPSFKVNRRVIVRRLNLEQWISRHAVTPRPIADEGQDEPIAEIARRRGFTVGK